MYNLVGYSDCFDYDANNDPVFKFTLTNQTDTVTEATWEPSLPVTPDTGIEYQEFTLTLDKSTCVLTLTTTCTGGSSSPDTSGAWGGSGDSHVFSSSPFQARLDHEIATGACCGPGLDRDVGWVLSSESDLDTAGVEAIWTM